MKYEKEVKILNVDVKESMQKLEDIGAIFKGKKEQKIYVYDLPTIYYRYLEICELLKSDNKLMVETNKGKLAVLLEEFLDLIPDHELEDLLKTLCINDLKDILKLETNRLLEKLEHESFKRLISHYKINPNKWIRLRQSNDKVELTTKHVFDKKNMTVQAVGEREVNTSSFEETNSILESIGIIRRSYQEKIRYSYEFDGASIEIDIWPKLNPYIEVECENTDKIEDIINKLGYSHNSVVSTNTKQLYKNIGINLEDISELKF